MKVFIVTIFLGFLATLIAGEVFDGKFDLPDGGWAVYNRSCAERYETLRSVVKVPFTIAAVSI